MGEFELIQRFFSGHDGAADVALGVGDDAALLLPPAGEQLAVSTDTLVAGRHFPLATTSCDIGWKALAVNLSDLAAMGATPRWCLLALTLPEADDAFLAGFAEGFMAQARQAGVALVGGDTTRGPLAITVTVMGLVPVGQALCRHGAQVGDHVVVSGALGEAGLGLRLALGQEDGHGLSAAGQAHLLERLNRPQPRLALGRLLRGVASSALDLSDGLAQDLGHILARSGVGADLRLEQLPLGEALRGRDDAVQLALSAGDDYELCFTVPEAALAQLAAISRDSRLPLTTIGRITAEPGLRLWQQGKQVSLTASGFQHFQPS